MSILVTGGHGLIGSHVVKELIENQTDVVVSTPTNQPNTILENYIGKYKIIQGDITKRQDVLNIIDQNRVTGIIHLAAITNNRSCEEMPVEAYDVNVKASVNLMEATRINRLDRLVIASSAAIFSKWNNIHKSISEDDTPSPQNMYSTHKFCVEQVARAYRETYGTPIVIPRLSRVYGPGIFPTALPTGSSPIPQLLWELIKNKNIILDTGGEFCADFSYVKDVAHGLILCLKTNPLPSLIQNIGNGELNSIMEVAEIIRQMYPDVQISIGPTAFPYDSNAPMRGALDISRARKELKYVPQFMLRNGIQDYLQWLIDQSDSSNKSTII